ncbi:MAG: low temperature requirement protein A [bacterium]
MAMHNRWFHRPRLHSPRAGNARRVEWLELFYDLIYVAAFIQLGNALSAEPGAFGVLTFAALFVPIWSAWTSFTFFANRFIVDDFVHRLLVFGQMFAIGGMAIGVGDVFAGRPAAFATCYALVRLFLVALYARAWLQGHGGQSLARRNTLGFGLGAALWITAIFVPWPWIFLVWAAAALVDFAVPLNRRARAESLRYPPDVLHMSERYGLLTLIVLGESFVKVLSAGAEHSLSPALAGMGALSLLVTFSLWWIYFDDVAGSRIKKGDLTAFVWIYTHLPLALGITAAGVAIKKAALMDPDLAGTGKYRWLLCGALALVFACVTIIDAVTERRVAEAKDEHRVNARAISAAVMLLLAPAGAFMPAWAFVGLVTVVCVAQVVIDLAMAPYADPHEAHHESPRLFGEAEDEDPAPAPAPTGPRRIRDPRDFVRRGAPSELRADLYFHLMEGTWRQLFALFVAAFLLINVVFASIYLLDEESIVGMAQPSFAQAFFFSVQTIATIGYGTLSPGSGFANAVVVVEAIVGVIMTALVTGLIFAKAARPRGSVLFSRPMIIKMHEGKPTLMFRVGNARGNEVIEASIRVVVICESTTAEGESMRRIYDLPLVRDNSPLFTLSWTVMHVIDERSPLYGISPEEMEERIVTFTVTMTAFDATYAQQTHARWLYHPADIRIGHRFVDILKSDEHGAMVLDYRVFHDTIADPAHPPVWGPGTAAA